MGERPISVSHPLFIIVQFNSTNCIKEINERLCHIKWLIYSCKTDILRKFYFFFYVPFRFVGKEPKGRPKERGDCDFSPFLWNPIPIALFVHT